VSDYAQWTCSSTPSGLQDHLDDSKHPHRRGRREPRPLRRVPYPGRDRVRLGRRTCQGPGQGATSSGPRSSARCSARAAISKRAHDRAIPADRNNWFAAYTYWYLKYYGHDRTVQARQRPAREKWIDEDRPTTTDVPPDPRTHHLHGPSRGDDTIPGQRRDEVARCPRRRHQAGRRPARPQEYSGELIAMPGLRAGGGRRSAPANIPGAAVGCRGRQGGARGPARFQVGRRAERGCTAPRAVTDGGADHRLLPDRRALRAHLVRAARAARAKPDVKNLRRLVDRVGQHGQRPDRGSRS